MEVMFVLPNLYLLHFFSHLPSSLSLFFFVFCFSFCFFFSFFFLTSLPPRLNVAGETGSVSLSEMKLIVTVLGWALNI